MSRPPKASTVNSVFGPNKSPLSLHLRGFTSAQRAPPPATWSPPPNRVVIPVLPSHVWTEVLYAMTVKVSQGPIDKRSQMIPRGSSASSHHGQWCRSAQHKLCILLLSKWMQIDWATCHLVMAVQRSDYVIELYAVLMKHCSLYSQQHVC
jgi:hypothetical protein